MSAPLVLTLANLKGGTAKTTSAVYLAHALVGMGRQVILLDADPQGSALRWAGMADWPLPAAGLATATLHRQIWGVVDATRYDTVVIDTPPLEEAQGVVASALRVATAVVVPLAPTMMEVDRLGPVWRAIEDAAGNRDDDPAVGVLLTRTVPNAASTDAIRGLLVDQGRYVFDASVPRRERYAQAFGGEVPTNDDMYAPVAAELLSLVKP